VAAAIALAIVLVIAVGGVSLAMQTQRPLQPQARPARAEPRGPVIGGRIRNRRPSSGGSEPPVPSGAAETPLSPLPPQNPATKGPELLRTGVPAEAKVVNVVDERVVGSVTRSRLTLRIEPEGGDPFEVDLRHAFPSLESRSKVKIGGTIAVHYDKDKPKKVVIDPSTDA
jgi:hypothetical protein